MKNTHKKLEHIEHDQHAVHLPFDRRVAMSMAILAAGLACATMLSHRAHNDTLRLQLEASVLQTQASDQWSYYQAKNIRDHEYRSALDMLSVFVKEPGQEEAVQEVRGRWSAQVAKYQSELPEMQAKAEQLEHDAHDRKEESHHFHERAKRFDLGELGIELGLVLCSIAVLTKRALFWSSGMVAGVIGAGVGLTAFLIH